MTTEYKLSGLKCADCVTTVEKALTSLTGVASATVTRDKVVLEADRELSVSQLNAELKKIGHYSVEPIADRAAPSCCCRE